jgi:hypothetical protein
VATTAPTPAATCLTEVGLMQHIERARVSVAAVVEPTSREPSSINTSRPARSSWMRLPRPVTNESLTKPSRPRVEASWRERALNAEDALKHAHTEIALQRNNIGQMLGKIRDLENDLAEDGVRRSARTQHSNSRSASSPRTSAGWRAPDRSS